MSEIIPTVDKWYSVYVPTQGNTAISYASYFRMGTPDSTAEAARLTDLQSPYASTAAQVAVTSAFGGNPTSGIALYTDGDLVQFVNGRVDTRVLNDSFMVHVLNKADLAPTAPTYRSYLRLGKPNDAVERQLKGISADAANLRAYVAALAPALPAASTEITAAVKATKIEAVLAAANSDARVFLRAAAASGDTVAIQALEDLRVSADARAAVAHNGATANAWALASLRALHDSFAGAVRDQALMGATAARTLLIARATAGDPAAHQKLVELAESKVLAARTSQNSQTPANTWAKAALTALPGTPDVPASWSAGDGVSIYSDRPVAITTPAALKVTVGSETRTVLGPTYNEVYDVDDEVIAQIRSGVITQAAQIESKRLITASLTARASTGPTWRTTKFDQARALTYSLTDVGTFAISSTYIFALGLKLTSGISGSFDGSVGVDVKIPTSLKVELGAKRMETSWSGGKVSYSSDQDLKGNNVKIHVASVGDVVVSTAREQLVRGVRAGMVLVNVLTLAYTAVGVGIGNSKSGQGDDSTENMRTFLRRGERVYLAGAALNAIFMAAGLVVGAMQLAAKKTAAVAEAAAPAQPSNIALSAAGIKLQCGTSYLEITPAGISASGPIVNINAPAVAIAAAPRPPLFHNELEPLGIEDENFLRGIGML